MADAISIARIALEKSERAEVLATTADTRVRDLGDRFSDALEAWGQRLDTLSNQLRALADTDRRMLERFNDYLLLRAAEIPPNGSFRREQTQPGLGPIDEITTRDEMRRVAEEQARKDSDARKLRRLNFFQRAISEGVSKTIQNGVTVILILAVGWLLHWASTTWHH